MAVEGDDGRNGLLARGVGDGLAEDVLVAEVNAVENADGRADRARAGLQGGGIGNDFHPAGRLAWAASFKNGMTRFWKSAEESLSTSSNGKASSTSNLPETTRRKVAR